MSLPQPIDPIQPDPVEEIVPATIDDVEGIHALIEEASQVTTVLPRSRDSICEYLRDFLVVRRDGEVVGCGALHVFTRNLAEIKSLVVAPKMRGEGVGRRLVAALVDEARRLGVKRIFALTDSVPFFQAQGFSIVDKSTLPHKVWNECIRCPKFFNCQEVAVDMVFEPRAPRSPRSLGVRD